MAIYAIAVPPVSYPLPGRCGFRYEVRDDATTPHTLLAADTVTLDIPPAAVDDPRPGNHPPIPVPAIDRRAEILGTITAFLKTRVRAAESKAAGDTAALEAAVAAGTVRFP